MTNLIRTGTAASILGTSRQHVVDLVARGSLRNHGVGVHRRLDRLDVERLVQDRRTRDQRKSLWLHTAVAGRLVTDPNRALRQARANLRRMREAHARPSPWLRRWEHLIDEGPEKVVRALIADTPEASELRQNSPFAGVLTAPERSRALEAFRAAEQATPK